jgi:hypothetical protein
MEMLSMRLGISISISSGGMPEGVSFAWAAKTSACKSTNNRNNLKTSRILTYLLMTQKCAYIMTVCFENVKWYNYDFAARCR